MSGSGDNASAKGKGSTNKSRNRSNGNGNGSGGGSGNKNRSRKRSRSKKRKIKPGQYWGDPATLPAPVEFHGSVSDPTAVVSSLGRPPLPGQEAAAQHFFSMVYERAAALAIALAAVGGTTDETADDTPPGDSTAS